DLPGAARPRADGLDQLQMGRVGKQPPRQVLLDHAGRAEATRRGRRELAAGVRNHDPVSRTLGGKHMTWLRIFTRRLRGIFLKRSMERDLEDEIRAHLEMQIEDNLRLGMSPDEARRAALRKFGGVEQVKESYRDRRGLLIVEVALQDLRYALRSLR